MIDWVHTSCQEWSRQYRNRRFDTGYPPRSMLGKLVEEGAGAGSSKFYQHFPEVYRGDAMDVSIAVQRMTGTMRLEWACAVFIAHYLFAGKAKAKARELNLNMADYWRHLHSAHCFIAGHIQQPKAA